MLLYFRVAWPLIFGSLSFMWAVLGSDLDLESYVIACGATAGGLMCLLISAHGCERETKAGGWRLYVLISVSVMVGAGCALTFGSPATSTSLALAVAVLTHVIAGVGAVLFLRERLPDES